MKVVDYEHSPVVSWMYTIHALIVLSHYAIAMDITTFRRLTRVYGTVMHIIWLLSIHAWLWALSAGAVAYAQFVYDKGIWHGDSIFRVCSAVHGPR